MRDFQTKSNQGALPDSNSATKLGGGEATSLRTEAKNAVSSAGLILAPQDGTGEDTTQLPQALLINGVSAQAFQDSGVADAIVLTPETGSSGLKLPPDYTTLKGAEFSFFASFTTLTTTPTASIGQTVPAQFGVKNIVREDGTALAIGDITTTTMTTLRRDDANDRWLLIRGEGTKGGATAATQSEQEAGTANNVFVTPENQKFNESASKAWANVNGTGTVAIRDSFNILGIVDNGVGVYTLSFTNDMDDVNYSIPSGSSGPSLAAFGISQGLTGKAVGSYQHSHFNSQTGASVDVLEYSSSVFGKLA